MKYFNTLKTTTLLATTLMVSLFASQSVMAGEEGPQDEYAGHSHAMSSDKTEMKNCMKNQRVNYSLPDHSTVESSLNDSVFPDPEH